MMDHRVNDQELIEVLKVLTESLTELRQKLELLCTMVMLAEWQYFEDGRCNYRWEDAREPRAA